LSGNQSPSAAVAQLLPPYRIVRDFLDHDIADALLDYAVDHEPAFEPTQIGQHGQGAVVPHARISLAVREMGEFRLLLRDRLREHRDQLVADLGVDRPKSSRYEFQLVAHGDGAFYRRHIDTTTGGDNSYVRLLSAVYYVHRRPRAFEGGALRLHSFVPNSDSHVDVAPDHNTLLVFPSWAPHEVMPVRCPSSRFADARFAVNIWVYGERPSGSGL